MKKILLYGNCQLGNLSLLIKSRIKDIEIIRPRNFNIPILRPWQENVFFPPTVLKNKGFLKALEVCDVFIFQDIKNDDYWKTKDLNKDIRRFDEIILTNFYFNYADPTQSILNLENRSNSIKKENNCPFIDMVPWIKQNYNKINILEKETEFNHPINEYYEYLLMELLKKNIV